MTSNLNYAPDDLRSMIDPNAKEVGGVSTLVSDPVDPRYMKTLHDIQRFEEFGGDQPLTRNVDGAVPNPLIDYTYRWSFPMEDFNKKQLQLIWTLGDSELSEYIRGLVRKNGAIVAEQAEAIAFLRYYISTLADRQASVHFTRIGAVAYLDNSERFCTQCHKPKKYEELVRCDKCGLMDLCVECTTHNLCRKDKKKKERKNRNNKKKVKTPAKLPDAKRPERPEHTEARCLNFQKKIAKFITPWLVGGFRVCGHCLKPNPMIMCDTCRIHMYCSQSCFEKDWHVWVSKEELQKRYDEEYNKALEKFKKGESDEEKKKQITIAPIKPDAKDTDKLKAMDPEKKEEGKKPKAELTAPVRQVATAGRFEAGRHYPECVAHVERLSGIEAKLLKAQGVVEDTMQYASGPGAKAQATSANASAAAAPTAAAVPLK